MLRYVSKRKLETMLIFLLKDLTWHLTSKWIVKQKESQQYMIYTQLPTTLEVLMEVTTQLVVRILMENGMTSTTALYL